MAPSTAMAANQTRQIGPNQVATLPVPRDWMRNSPTRIASVISSTTAGVTRSARAGTDLRPSTADRTEIDGVITASP